MSPQDALRDRRSAPTTALQTVGFALFFADGALLGFGVASILTIGAALIAAGLIGFALLARTARLRDSWPGLVAGPAAVLLFLAYLNRSGPGDVCTTTTTGGEACTQEYSPWPFLAIAILLLAAAVALAFRLVPRDQ